MTLDHYKQLDHLILDELNIKILSRAIAKADGENVYFVYDGKDYYLETKNISKKLSEEKALTIVKNFYD